MKKTRLQMIPVAKLVALKRNPQYLTPKQMDSLKASIKRDGFCAPILVRPISGDRYEVISGNHRFMAACELRMAEVPCVVLRMTARTAKRLAVNLNTIHGDPNAELLAPFLADMDESILQDIHLANDTLAELLEFDNHLAERLAALEPPDSLNRDSPQGGKSGCCTCPKCGKKHFKP